MPTLSFTSVDKPEKSGYAWKISIFGIIGVVLCLIVGFSVNEALFQESFLGISGIWLLIAATFLFLANFALESALAEDLRLVFITLQSIAVVVGLYLARSGAFAIWQLGWIIIFFIILLFARNSIQNSSQDMLKLHWHRMTKKGLAEAALPILLLVSIGFGFSLWQKSASGFFLSEKSLASVLNVGNPIARLYYKDFDWNMTVDDFVKVAASRAVDSTLEKMFGSNSGIVVENQKKVLVDQSIGAVKTQFSQFVGFELKGSESVSSVLYKFLSNKVDSLPINIRRIIIAVFVFLFFVTIKFLLPIITFLSRMFSYLIHETLIGLGFSQIIYEGRTKEVIHLP